MYKKDVKTLEDIDTYVSNPRFKIRFTDKAEKHYKLKRNGGINMIFLVDLMLIRKLPTIHANTGREHCSQGRYRSVYDLMLICKYYNQNITLKELFTVIAKMLSRDPELGFMSLPYFSFCPNIQKWNFRGVTSPYNTETMLKWLRNYTFRDSFPSSEVKVSDIVTF